MLYKLEFKGKLNFTIRICNLNTGIYVTNVTILNIRT